MSVEVIENLELVEVLRGHGDDVSVLRNKENSAEYAVPSKYINLFKSYNESTEYNYLKSTVRGIDYLSIIHPDFTIGAEVMLEIEGVEHENGEDYFLLKSDYYSKLKVRKFSWQDGMDSVKCKVKSYKRGMPLLLNIDSSTSIWKVGRKYKFKILKESSYLNKNGVEKPSLIVELDEKTKVNVSIYEWQKQCHWKYVDLECKVTGFSFEGVPRLIAFDSRHPYYEKNIAYRFEIVDINEKYDMSQTRSYKVSLKDAYNLHYEVDLLHEQIDKLKVGTSLDCIYYGVDYKVHLKASDSVDPYFKEFDDICDIKGLKKKYFSDVIEFKSGLTTRLQHQYFQKHAFWVITYCNEVLPELKKEKLKNKNYREVEEIINLQLIFENWIVNSGVLNAINIQEERKFVSLKAQNIIGKCRSELEVIRLINDSTIVLKEFIDENRGSIEHNEIYSFIKFCSLRDINYLSVREILNNQDGIEHHLLKQIAFVISFKKNEYKGAKLKEYFVPSSELTIEQRRGYQNYVNWSFVEFEILKSVNDVIGANYVFANICRILSQLSNLRTEGELLLLNAHEILLNISSTHKHDFLIIKNGDLSVESKKIESPYDSDNLREDEIHIAQLYRRNHKGYDAKIGSYTGYLPIQSVSDLSLKKYAFTEVNWSVAVKTMLVSHRFQFAVLNQLDNTDENYVSKNLNKTSLTVGEVVRGVVKAVKNYGVFVTTEFGDALLKINDVKDGYCSQFELNNIFVIGEQIKIVISEIDKQGKIFLSFVSLKNTKFKNFYNNKIQSVYEEKVDNSIESKLKFKIEFEKGVVFERFAIFQEDLNSKIKYLKIAKSFYSNTQSSRSYLLNIYIDYFNFVLNLGVLLNDYSYNKYEDFKNDILSVYDRVNSQTVTQFPESKNLVFFIEILKCFNSKEEKDLLKLFELTQNPFETGDYKLKIVAKNALANNLIISDLDQYTEDSLDVFTYKNLDRIYKYLINGVHSITTSISEEERLNRYEKIKSIKRLIEEDEGQKLEFKSTFRTPVDNRFKEISDLKKRLEQATTQKAKKGISKQIEKLSQPVVRTDEELSALRLKLIHSSLKTLCAFANTEGGTLLIGVTDDKEIIGLGLDYLNQRKSNDRDEFGKIFDSLVESYLGNSFSASCLTKEFVKFPEGDVLCIKVKPSVDEVFLQKDADGNKNESLYVRRLTSTVKLSGSELSRFIKNRLIDTMRDKSVTGNNQE